MISQSTFSRFFKKFDRDRSDSIFPTLNRFWFSQLKLDKLTIDIDSTDIIRFGQQEGVAKVIHQESIDVALATSINFFLLEEFFSTDAAFR
jgi:hypothetical protein